jgi:solute carrier family 25 thiamine pyrophosphate transporter 19
VTNFGVGAVAGGVAAFACHPLDVIRTRFVGQGEPKIYPSVPRAVIMMYHEKGILTFYRGLLPSLMYTAAQAGLSFGFYHGYIKLLTHYAPFIHQSLVFPLCGVVAGVCSKTIVLPFDLIKKRLAVQGFEEARKVFGRTAHYSGAIHCFRKIVREEGVLAFYKGTAPSIIKAGFSISLSFLFYEHTLHWLKSRHDR